MSHFFECRGVSKVISLVLTAILFFLLIPGRITAMVDVEADATGVSNPQNVTNSVYGIVYTPTPTMSTTVISLDLTLSEDKVYENLVINSGTLKLNGHKILVKGNLEQSGGTLDINGGILQIEGNYTQLGISYLRMRNEKDRVLVKGNYVAKSQSYDNDNLTAGELEIKGDFSQIYTSDWYENNFVASGTHKVILSGEKTQTVKFERPLKSNFNILEIRNSSNDGVKSEGYVYVKKIITNGKRVCDLKLGVKGILTEDYLYAGPIYIAETLDAKGFNIDVKGLYVAGTLNLDGGKVTTTSLNIPKGSLNIDSGSIKVNGDVINRGILNVGKGYIEISKSYNETEKGCLKMNDERGYMLVNGSFTASSVNSYDGFLTAGTIEIKGDFNQIYVSGGSESNFLADKIHKVILDGEGVQKISFQNPVSSSFNILRITKPLEKGYIFSSQKVWKDLISNELIVKTEDDKQAPSIPQGLQIVEIGEKYIKLLWNASTDNDGIKFYNIYRNEERIASVNDTVYTDSSLSSETSYTYTVKAVDKSGNESLASNPVIGTTKNDTTVIPTPSIIATNTPIPTISSSGNGSGGSNGTVTIEDDSIPLNPQNTPLPIQSTPKETAEQKNAKIDAGYKSIQNSSTAEEAKQAVQEMVSKISLDDSEDKDYLDSFMGLLEFGVEKISSSSIASVDGKVNINADSITKSCQKANEAKEYIQKLLDEKGIEKQREMAAIAELKMDSTDERIAINFERSFQDACKNVDGINVVCNDIGITIDTKSVESQFENEDLLTIELAKIPEIATPSVNEEPTVMRDETKPQKNSAVKLSIKDSSGNEKKNLKQNIKLELPSINGSSEYQTVACSRGGNISYLGGRYDVGIRNMIVKTRTSGDYYVVENRKSFDDIALKAPEMVRAIEVLASKGLIAGYGNDEFKPDDKIKRSEFTTLIVNGLNKRDESATAYYNDVSENAWYYPYVASASREGIISGYEDNTFRGELCINKQEIIKVCAAALNTELKCIYPTNEDKYLDFKDKESIPKWVKKFVALANREGIIVEMEDGTFQGNIPCTRGYAALVLYRLYNKL